jgi:hypothetical protein
MKPAFFLWIDSIHLRTVEIAVLVDWLDKVAVQASFLIAFLYLTLTARSLWNPTDDHA